MELNSETKIKTKNLEILESEEYLDVTRNMAPMTSENRPLAPPVRGGRRDSSSEDDLDPGRDISDDDDDFEENDTSGSDESESDLEIPPDPVHEERMRNLRREHEFLLHVTAEQDEVLAQMRLRISEIQAATSRRRGELEELRRARDAEAKKKAEEEKQESEEGCQPPETEKKDGDNDKDGSSPAPI